MNTKVLKAIFDNFDLNKEKLSMVQQLVDGHVNPGSVSEKAKQVSENSGSFLNENPSLRHVRQVIVALNDILGTNGMGYAEDYEYLKRDTNDDITIIFEELGSHLLVCSVSEYESCLNGSNDAPIHPRSCVSEKPTFDKSNTNSEPQF